jgi:hypothetical protein
MEGRDKHSKQEGAALAIVLIVLVIATLLGLQGLRSTRLELLMAGHEQDKVAAFQAAQAGIDATLTDPNNFVVVGAPGYKNCTAGVAGCDVNDVVLPVAPFSSLNGSIDVEVTRLSPGALPPPRSLEFSADKYAVSAFNVDSDYDDVSNGGGQEHIAQGYLVLIPKTD